MSEAETIDEADREPEGRSFRQRLILWGATAVIVIGGWLIGAAVIPRWWAQRMGDLIDGRLAFGSLVGVTLGFLFTLLPLVVLKVGWRWQRSGWKRNLVTLGVAAVFAAPNLFTLGIVMGSGNAAHAGERILDVDGPGFRGGTLVGAILGALAAGGLAYLVSSRSRSKRKAAQLEAELRAK